jgi:tRNA (guanine9-N1)-methyltransferase
MDKDAKRQARAMRKAAEVTDFKARCASGTTVVVDLEWEDSMSEKELKSLVQQLLFSYGSNRGASHPVRLVFSGVAADSFTGQKLRKMAGFDTWPIEILEGPYIDRFPREELVYLTADAEVVLDSFEKDKVYVIGGIVDHNRLKGVTMAKAEEQSIAAAQLPISQHIDMGTFSRVLTVNHVLQIVLEHQAVGNWRQVFEKCIPGRKTFIDPSSKSGRDSGLDVACKSDKQAENRDVLDAGEACGNEPVSQLEMAAV